MADVFTNDLRIREQESGSNAGTWGGLLNTTIRNIASAFGQGSETIPNASTHTITLADGVADEARSLYLKCTGGGQACTVTLAPNTVSKVWIISNETSYTLTFSQGSGANVAVSAGAVKVIVTDGSGSGAAVVDALSGLDASLSGLTVDTTTLVVDATNNRVGIGTSSPSAKLTLNDAGQQVGIDFKEAGTTRAHIEYDGAIPALELGTNGAANVVLKTNNTERMRIDSSGNVGIGTTSLTPNATLSIAQGGVHVDGGASGGSSQVILSTGASSGSNFGQISNTGTRWALGYGGTQQTVGTEVLTWNSSNNVGIGTSSPNSLAHIYGGSSGRTWTPDGSDKLALENSDSVSFDIRTPSSNQGAILFSDADARARGVIAYSHASDIMYFNTAGAERLRINSVGDTFFGITSKTDTPSNGGVYIAGDNSVGSTNSYAQVFVIHNSVTNHGIILKELNSGGGQALQFLNSSATLVGSIATSASVTAYNTSSDYRLKENVVAMTGATARLKQLNPSRFNFIADPDSTVDGFLAHEVADVVPEAITGTKDAVDDDGNPVYQGIDQSKLVPLLVATIQELEARITQLENN